MKWNEAVSLLQSCEANLRTLVAQAAAEGDYGSVLRIAEMAKAVAALASQGNGSAASAMSIAASEIQPDNRGARVSAAPATSPRKVRPTDTYPRFFRRGDELVKVGWSKKDRREYNHRAGRAAIDAVTAAVRQVGTKGRLFTGDKLLPLKDPTEGSRLPDYQAYVALAWLKELGIVEQKGRKAGYSLVPDKQIESITTAAWAGLEEWRG